MKNFLAIVIISLCFIIPSKADDISDFEIEGMSIGDSLLNYFSEEEIKNNIMGDYYENNEYTAIEFPNKSFKNYDNVSVDLISLDKKYIIQTVTGILFYEDIRDCHMKQKKIDKELSIIFQNTRKETNTRNHSADKTGKSKTKAINYWFKSGDLATIICTDWSNDLTNKYGWSDNLSIELKTKKFNDFLSKLYK